MNFIEKIEDLCKNKNKVSIFVDMDGTIVEYDYAPELIKKNIKGKFLNQRPLNSILEKIKELKKIPNVELYILSACNFNDQANEKNIWLDNYADFFDKDRRIFVVKENEDYVLNDKKEMKAIYIERIINKNNSEFAILFDDNHDLLKKTDQRLKEKVAVFHVSSLID